MSGWKDVVANLIEQAERELDKAGGPADNPKEAYLIRHAASEYASKNFRQAKKDALEAARLLKEKNSVRT